jgi:hypothetical protein
VCTWTSSGTSWEKLRLHGPAIPHGTARQRHWGAAKHKQAPWTYRSPTVVQSPEIINYLLGSRSSWHLSKSRALGERTCKPVMFHVKPFSPTMRPASGLAPFVSRETGHRRAARNTSIVRPNQQRTNVRRQKPGPHGPSDPTRRPVAIYAHRDDGPIQSSLKKSRRPRCAQEQPSRRRYAQKQTSGRRCAQKQTSGRRYAQEQRRGRLSASCTGPPPTTVLAPRVANTVCVTSADSTISVDSAALEAIAERRVGSSANR